jgi:hypothetical protein
MLALGIDDVGIHLAVGDQLGDVLHQRGLRRYRIHGDHVRARQGDAQRSGFVAFDQHDFLLGRLGLGRCFKGGGTHAASESKKSALAIRWLGFTLPPFL